MVSGLLNVPPIALYNRVHVGVKLGTPFTAIHSREQKIMAMSVSVISMIVNKRPKTIEFTRTCNFPTRNNERFFSSDAGRGPVTCFFVHVNGRKCCLVRTHQRHFYLGYASNRTSSRCHDQFPLYNYGRGGYIDRQAIIGEDQFSLNVDPPVQIECTAGMVHCHTNTTRYNNFA